MYFLKRGINKILRFIRGSWIKFIYKKNIHVDSHARFEISRNSDFLFETKESHLILKGKMLALNYLFIKVCGTGCIEIGERVFFNNCCSITCMNKIKIGNDCLFGENVHIYDHNHNYRQIGKTISQQGFSIGEITIGNNVWIGTNVTILKNVHIGNNCIIGAGCVVYKDVPEGNILFCNGEMKKIEVTENESITNN